MVLLGLGEGMLPNTCMARRARHRRTPPAHAPAITFRANVSSDLLTWVPPPTRTSMAAHNPILVAPDTALWVARPTFDRRFGTFGNSAIGACESP